MTRIKPPAESCLRGIALVCAAIVGLAADDPEFYLKRGETLSAARHYERAIADYTTALQLKPDYAEAYNDRGFAYYLTGDAERAIADYTRAIELRPNYPKAYNNRGVAYMAHGYGAAKSVPDFDRAIALQPDFRYAYINRANARLVAHPWLALHDFHRAGMYPERTAAKVGGAIVAMIVGIAWIRRKVRKPVVLGVVAAIAMLRVDAAAVRAQTPRELRFEVASVKPMPSPAEVRRQAAAGGPVPRSGITILPGGRFTASLVTLKQLITNAFDVRDFQIEGGPAWLTSDNFEITATAGGDASPADIRAMLRTLLGERFGLRTHIDTRPSTQYVLTVARSDGRLGPRLKRTTPECQQELAQRKNSAAPTRPAQQTLSPIDSPDARPVCGSVIRVRAATGAARISQGGQELASLIRDISNELTAPVVDRTGLSGLFDIRLEFMSERQIGARAPGLDPNSTDPMPVPIAAALQSQLGLRLEKEIGPLPIVVIDAAERPTPD